MLYENAHIIASVCCANTIPLGFAGVLHDSFLKTTLLISPMCSAGKKKNQDFIQPLVAFPISNIPSEEVGRAKLNVATPTHLKLLQEGLKVNLNGFSVKILFHIKILLGIFEIFLKIYICKSRVDLWENLPKI